MVIDISKRIRSADVQLSKPGVEAVVAGFAAEVKSLGKIAFIKLRDRDGYLQLVSSDSKMIDKVTKISQESVILVEGKVKLSKLKAGGNEIEIENFEILSESEPKLPIEFMGKGIETNLDKRLDYRWIDLRNPKNLLVFKITTHFMKATRDFFIKKGLLELFSPKLIAHPSEGGGEEFAIPYFGKKAFLAQSPQFYKQMAQAAGFEGVFEVAPVFRANPSHTTRHDTEFTSLDVEISWIDHEGLMKFEEEWLSYAFGEVKSKFGKEIKEVFGIDLIVPKTPFPRITFADALKITGGKTIGSEEEKKICEYADKKFKHQFVFVTDFPISERPFYHMRMEKNQKITMSYDLLFKNIEITTGAHREHRYDVLVKQAKEKGLNIPSIQFYLNFFKWACPPHSGFGLSHTRVIMQMLNLPNVREATFVPRDTERLTP
ncbi:MAG: aspartate--tRNA(Asn) ligase [archaeon]